MRPIDEKAKNGNWIAVPKTNAIRFGECPFVLVRWRQERDESGDYYFMDEHGNVYYPDQYFKLI